MWQWRVPQHWCGLDAAERAEGDAGVLHDMVEAGWALVVEHLNLRCYPSVG